MDKEYKGICEISTLTNFTLNKNLSNSSQPPEKNDISYETVSEADKKGED